MLPQFAETPLNGASRGGWPPPPDDGRPKLLKLMEANYLLTVESIPLSLKSLVPMCGKETALRIIRDSLKDVIEQQMIAIGHCLLPLKRDYMVILQSELIKAYSGNFAVFVDSDLMYIVADQGANALMDYLGHEEMKLHASYVELQTLKQAVAEKFKIEQATDQGAWEQASTKELVSELIRRNGVKHFSIGQHDVQLVETVGPVTVVQIVAEGWQA